MRYKSPVERASVGRPRYVINKEQLQYLRSMSFTWIQIGDMLGVSYITVYRRKIEFEIADSRGRRITDEQVEKIVSDIRYEQPAVGQTMIWARIRSMGFDVTRAAVHKTDPINSAFRWNKMTPRRPYSVPGPNSLWHLGMYIALCFINHPINLLVIVFADGQHKLARWRMVVHAAIDRYSRTVLFIKCSDNNRASTVYGLFLEAVGQYGLPSRIRVDQGGENVQVAQHMPQ